MQVELSIVATIAASVMAGYVALLRYTIFNKEKELERRFEDLTKTLTKAQLECAEATGKLEGRINSEEKATIRQDGELKLVQQSHTQLSGDIEEIKRLMVTKSEWEQRMTGVERTLGQILSDLRNAMGRYSSSANNPTTAPPYPGTRKPGT